MCPSVDRRLVVKEIVCNAREAEHTVQDTSTQRRYVVSMLLSLNFGIFRSFPDSRRPVIFESRQFLWAISSYYCYHFRGITRTCPKLFRWYFKNLTKRRTGALCSTDKRNSLHSPHSASCTFHCWHSHVPLIYPIDAIVSVYIWSVFPIRAATRQIEWATSNWANRPMLPNWTRQICTMSNPNTTTLSNGKTERSAGVRRPSEWASANVANPIENRSVPFHLVRCTWAYRRICQAREIAYYVRARWVLSMMLSLRCHNTTATTIPNCVPTVRPYHRHLSYNCATLHVWVVFFVYH